MKPDRTRVLLEGLIAGALGYATIALTLGTLDLALGKPLFYTAAILGHALFFPGGDPALAPIAAGPIIAANGAHLVLSLVVGTGAAFLVLEAERHPDLFYVIFLLALFFVLSTTVALLGVPSSIGRAVPWWALLVANVAAALVAGAYLWRAHPRLRQELEMLAGDDGSMAAGTAGVGQPSAG